MMQGFLHSLIIFIICTYTINYDSLDSSGYSPDLWVFSISIYTCIIFLVDIKIALNTQYWTLIGLAVIICTSLLLYICYVFISSEIEQFAVYQTADSAFSTADFYFLIFFTVGVVTIFDQLVSIVQAESGGMINYLKNIIRDKKYVDD